MNEDCRNRDFLPFCSCDLDLHLMTFIYEPDPYSLDKYRMCKYELPTLKHSKVIVSQTERQTVRHTDRQTDMTEIIHHAASRMVKNMT